VTLLPISASSAQCSAGFDMDTLSIFMAAPLPMGTYTLYIKDGTDGNTLKDNCDKLIPVGENVTFTVFPLVPTPMDSVTKPKCAPESLELVFPKNIKCSSIDPAGGDFNITGPYPVTITSAQFTCTNGETNRIILKLSAPMQVAGNFTINLQTGPDGNTIIDECNLETPLPESVNFSVSDTVNADFTYNINYSCAVNTVSYMHPGANSVNSWLWAFGSAPNSTAQNPVISYTNFQPKTTTLIVSNGVCADTTSQQIVFANYLKANFEVTPLVCPDKKVEFKNTSEGTIVSWKWIFGNGTISNVKDPVPQYYTPLAAADYNAFPELIIQNNFGCFDTIRKPVTIVYSCFITVPSAFTPNGDGLNDYLYPLKAYKSSNLSFSIFNRFGQRVFYSNNWLNKWDGTYKGLRQDPGTYVWMLDYINLETGQHVFQKGTSILIR
jgi:gliding motility-associated-like protein